VSCTKAELTAEHTPVAVTPVPVMAALSPAFLPVVVVVSVPSVAPPLLTSDFQHTVLLI
jgi:hypothetical protein